MIRVIERLVCALCLVAIVAVLTVWTFGEDTTPTRTVVTTTRVQTVPQRTVLYCSQATAPRGCVMGFAP